MYTTRYNCQSCSRMFMASETATRVKCPNCQFLNVFVPEPELLLPPWVEKEIPIYTPEEASARALELLGENAETTEGWEKIAVTYEGIDACYAKAIAVNQNGENVYATKVSAIINGTVKQIFNIYWDPKAEMQWNAATCAKIQILHDDFTNQLILQQQKKLATVNIQNDLCYRRFFNETENQIWIYCVSEKTTPEVQPGWVRGIVVLGGFLIEALDANSCMVSLIWSFDVNKKLSVKLKDEESKKTALRLCKIKKKLEDDARLADRTQEYQAQKERGKDTNVPSGPSSTVNACPFCKREVPGKYCTGCGKATYQCCTTCYTRAQGPTCSVCGSRFFF